MKFSPMHWADAGNTCPFAKDVVRLGDFYFLMRSLSRVEIDGGDWPEVN